MRRRGWYRGGTAIVAGVLAACLAGCAGKPQPQVVTYRRGTVPDRPVAAAYDGPYVLVAGEAGEPDYTANVRKGEPVGFVRKSDDSIVAVAGKQEVPLASRLVDSYRWQSLAPDDPAPTTAPATEPSAGAAEPE